MGLSSNILWHQTDKKGLMSILKEKRLRYGYSRESIFVKAKKDELAIPMVSVCDLPFSEMDSFLGKYGNYAIGLSLDWGKRNGLNPVWYCLGKSDVLTQIAKRLEKAESLEERKTIFDILSYVKFVEGVLPKKNYRNYRFYDEREYRKCPTMDELYKGNFKPILTESEYSKYKEEHSNSSSMDLGVPFEWADIKFIVVYNEQNIDEVKEELQKRGCDNSLISIFTENQVRQDFIGIKHDELYVQESDNPIMDLITGRKSIVELMIQEMKNNKVE